MKGMKQMLMNSSLHEQAVKISQENYVVQIIRDDSNSEEVLYVALNPELEGCVAQGLTPEEAKMILDEFRVEYILNLLEHNLPIPHPDQRGTTTGYSVKPTIYQATVYITNKDTQLEDADEVDVDNNLISHQDIQLSY
jgi:predicted RNase H-like HicB family nuclease